VDTAGYTDSLFGLTSLLSIYYAPRIKDLPDQRLFFFDTKDSQAFANIGPLLSAKINMHVIKAQWDKIMELVAAVEQGLVPASRIQRKLQAAGNHNNLFRALQDLGRISKTIYLLHYLSDKDLRRQVERQLNKTEHYNSLAKIIFWGQKGEMRSAALEDQLNRASCLRLVAAIVILFNAAYLQSAVEHERALGKAITDDQLAHIFPTTTASINMLGEYTFHDELALITDINERPTIEPRFEQLDLGL
jgi:TnpA family transposase